MIRGDYSEKPPGSQPDLKNHFLQPQQSIVFLSQSPFRPRNDAALDIPPGRLSVFPVEYLDTGSEEHFPDLIRKLEVLPDPRSFPHGDEIPDNRFARSSASLLLHPHEFEDPIDEPHQGERLFRVFLVVVSCDDEPVDPADEAEDVGEGGRRVEIIIHGRPEFLLELGHDPGESGAVGSSWILQELENEIIDGLQTIRCSHQHLLLHVDLLRVVIRQDEISDHFGAVAIEELLHGDEVPERFGHLDAVDEQQSGV